MSLIQVDRLSFSYAGRPILRDVSFSVGERDRIGVVGANGSGKSTLLALLEGRLQPDHGEIVRKRGLVIGVMPQAVEPARLEESLYAYLQAALPADEADWATWKVEVALESLGIDAESWSLPMGALSGGWQRLILAAASGLAQPDLLLLDEPTNHLDLSRIFRLERWLLEAVEVPYLVTSHDREFLDDCTDKTLIVREDGVHSYRAAFSEAWAERLREDAEALRKQQKEEAEIRRLETAAKRLRVWATQKGPNPKLARRAKAVGSRARQLRERQTLAHRERRRDLDLEGQRVDPHTLIRIENLAVAAPDGRTLFRIDRLYIGKGDRVAILGPNGCGKSVFLARLIACTPGLDAAPAPDSKLLVNPQVAFGYMDQHLRDLPADLRIGRAVQARVSIDRTGLVRELSNIGIPVHRQDQRLGDLSYGERARLSFLIMKLLKPNVFVLDEPTNHLDIPGRYQLEEVLDDDSKSCLLVSHDRRLLRGVPNRYLEIRDGRLLEVEGPEDFFARLRALSLAEEKRQAAKGGGAARVPSV